MLKEMLIRCTQLLDRDDLTDAIKNNSSVETIENQLIKNDIKKLIMIYNDASALLYEKYIELKFTDYLCADQNGRIYYQNFTFRPLKILKINDKIASKNYQIFPFFCEVKDGLSQNKIEYNYLPNEAKDFSDETQSGVYDDVIVCEIISKYFAIKSKYNESEYWHDKFQNELFNLKTKKERVFKPNILL